MRHQPQPMNWRERLDEQAEESCGMSVKYRREGEQCAEIRSMELYLADLSRGRVVHVVDFYTQTPVLTVTLT